MVNLHRDGAWPGTKVDVESEVSTRLRNQTRIPTRTIHGPVTDERISTELGDGGIIWEERNLLNPSYGSFLSSVLFRLEGDVSFLPFFFYFFESEIKIEILRDTQGEVAVLRRNNVWRMSFRGNGTKVLCAREKVFGEFVTREQVSVLQSVQKTSVAFAPALFREVLYI